MELSDVNFASRVRGVLETIARRIVREESPSFRHGNVVRFNRFSGTCDVILQGDTEPVRVSMTKLQQPTYSSEGLANYAGDVVRVGGSPGSYYLDRVISVQNFSVSPNMYNPTIWTGEFFHVPTILYDSYGSGLPAVGSTWHIGRWNNDPSFASDAQGMVQIEIQWTFFTAQTKKYQFVIRPNSTNAGWVKLAPILDSGPLNDNEFGLEVLVDTLGFELRVRRIAQGAGFSPAGWDVRLQIWMDNAYRVQNSALGEQVTTAPTKFLGAQQDIKVDKGPFLGPHMVLPRLAQSDIHGGGKITWDGSTLDWSQPFRIHGLGMGFHAQSGFFECARPAASTAISVYGNSAVSSVTVIAGGVPLANDQALYYEPPWGGTSTSVAGNFRIVDPVNTEFSVPSHWILIAQRCSQTGSPSLKLGTGEEIDHWRAPTFANSWVNYGTPFDTAAYKLLDGRIVKLKGLIKLGTLNTAAFVLPAAYWPSADKLFSSVYWNGTIDTSGRVDVTATGGVVIKVTNNTYVSLENVSYYLS